MRVITGKESQAQLQVKRENSALDDIMQVIIIDANATASTLTVCELRDKYDKYALFIFRWKRKRRRK